MCKEIVFAAAYFYHIWQQENDWFSLKVLTEYEQPHPYMCVWKGIFCITAC